jgi:hypothetical protein
MLLGFGLTVAIQMWGTEFYFEILEAATCTCRAKPEEGFSNRFDRAIAVVSFG